MNGDDFDVFVVYFTSALSAREVTRTIMGGSTPDGYDHYTVRGVKDGKVIVSYRIHKDASNYEAIVREYLIGTGVQYEENPDNENHAWIKKGEEDDRWDPMSVAILHWTSKFAVQQMNPQFTNRVDRIQMAHLFQNMLFLNEDVIEKVSDTVGKRIIGPGYQDLLNVEKGDGVYYHAPGRYEKVARAFVSKTKRRRHHN